MARLPFIDSLLDPERVDELYGLEPVWEPGRSDAALGAFAEIQCPSCGEVGGTSVDLTTADRSWIEDCQVCCAPMQIDVEVSERGELIAARASPMR